MKLWKLSLRSLLRQCRGATAIEFAIVIPVVLLLVFGTLEYAILMTAASAVQNATDAAARSSTLADVGSENRDEAFLKRMVQDRDANIFINARRIQVSSRVIDRPQGRELIEYTVTYNWPIITPLLGSALKTEGCEPAPCRTITTRSVSRVEQATGSIASPPGGGGGGPTCGAPPLPPCTPSCGVGGTPPCCADGTPPPCSGGGGGGGGGGDCCPVNDRACTICPILN